MGISLPNIIIIHNYHDSALHIRICAYIITVWTEIMSQHYFL